MEWQWAGNGSTGLRVGKVVCVGRNYVEHAKELGNTVPEKPLLFLKPSTAVCSLEEGFAIPRDKGRVHHELELAVLMGNWLKDGSEQEARQAMAGIGLALDLTLRDRQEELKQQGYPWEEAKAFDDSCPTSRFIPMAEIEQLDAIPLALHRNGELRQSGHSGQMIIPILKLISHISRIFTLEPGDVVLTGTPAGVGELAPGDELIVEIPGKMRVLSQVR
ncbi:fumarylacetoacetate hydrolase family protein [Gallaecimonas sp. GXIMD4217]|uniref:fumarylacetoacetate hydrolase family protein n=1 Tax=Gallaecimonas sp. GXIMD4217 TaxID=3131927 RepID=UPI00311AC7DC